MEKVEYYQDKEGWWKWRFPIGGGEYIGCDFGYMTKRDAMSNYEHRVAKAKDSIDKR